MLVLVLRAPLRLQQIIAEQARAQKALTDKYSFWPRQGIIEYRFIFPSQQTYDTFATWAKAYASIEILERKDP